MELGPDPRVEGNYLQALMQFWVGINANIWQGLALTLGGETTAVLIAFGARGTVVSIGVMLLASLFVVLMMVHTASNQRLRGRIRVQIDMLADRYMAPLEPNPLAPQI